MIKTRLPSQYSPVQKWFHWLMALLILSMLVIGVTMKNMNNGALKDWLYEFHKSIGISLLALALVRVAVRWRRGEPLHGSAGWWRGLGGVGGAPLS